MTPLGIEPATSQLVAQCLKQQFVTATTTKMLPSRLRHNIFGRQLPVFRRNIIIPSSEHYSAVYVTAALSFATLVAVGRPRKLYHLLNIIVALNLTASNGLPPSGEKSVSVVALSNGRSLARIKKCFI
jgi:hypothetical protein